MAAITNEVGSFVHTKESRAGIFGDEVHGFRIIEITFFDFPERAVELEHGAGDFDGVGELGINVDEQVQREAFGDGTDFDATEFTGCKVVARQDDQRSKHADDTCGETQSPAP